MDFFSEKQIEQRLSAAVKKSSGLALKFVSPSFAGMPDRLVLLPDGKMAFVEVKVLGLRCRGPLASRCSSWTVPVTSPG